MCCAPPPPSPPHSQIAFMICAPLAVAGALLLLWFQIGWAALIGAAILALSTPVSSYSVNIVRRYRGGGVGGGGVRRY